MPGIIQSYVRFIDRVNHRIGRVMIYFIFAMMAVLFYSSISKVFFKPSLWTLEMAQFMMVAYFLLGGAYSLQLNGHVRMDLFYSRWAPRTQYKMDAVTALCMIVYLVLLLVGAIASTVYAIQYGERSYSIWRPYMWPIKIVMLFGIWMMLLQAIAQFFKDWAAARGEPLS